MRFVFALFVLLLPCGVVYSQTTELREAPDASLMILLSNMEIIAERADPVDRTFPYFLRIIRVKSDGECSPKKARSCPKEFVYILVSTRDDAPDRKLYRLPDAYGWALDGWAYLPRNELPKEFIVFEMSKKVPADSPAGYPWSEEIYEIRVNVFSGSMRKISR